VGRVLAVHHHETLHTLLELEVAAADRLVAVVHEVGRQLLGRVVDQGLRELLVALLNKSQFGRQELAATVVLAGISELLGNLMQSLAREDASRSFIRCVQTLR